MQRSQNTHAYVNAGFLFKLNKDNKHQITQQPNIVFGGINSNFVCIPCDLDNNFS